MLADFGFELPDGHRNPGLGFDRRDPLSGAADAPRGHRRLERGAARRPRHARQHDRHRACRSSRTRSPDERRARHGRHGRVRPGRSPSRTSRSFTPNGNGARLRSRWRWATPGGWNIDMSRFARENRPPQDYLSKSYYQIWLAGLERLMLERGLVTADEIAAGKPLHPAKPVAKTLSLTVSRRCCTAADRPSARHPPALSRSATACAPRSSIPDPYAAAALCARPCRRRRDAARLSRVSGHQRDGPGRIRNGSTP